MSKVSVKTSVTSRTATENSKTSIKDNEEIDLSTQPEFIYGGPFARVVKPMFVDTITPINIQLQGTFKRSFAYHSLKERFPVILTKIIDYLSREGAKIKSANGASDENIRSLIQYIVQLKNEIATNKAYSLLSADTPDALKWNEWIKNADSPYYFTNNWVFSECYVYRRLRDGCELSKLANFDPFEEQKMQSFSGSLEPMCVVAEKVVDMLQESEKEKRKADFITLLKICLWSNKCDLSLSMGEQVSLVNKDDMTSSPSQTLIDPLQMILDLKDKVLADDSAKICDQVIARAENIAKAIEAGPSLKAKCSCSRLAVLAGVRVCEPLPQGEEPSPPPGQEGGEEPPEPPCPAKVTTPPTVMFDIVCDNAGYELFSDLCLADFLISQNIVKKVRFHVKSIPWFVSDVTPRDFKFVISECSRASFSKVVQPPVAQPGTEPTEGAEAAPSPRSVGADALRRLGDRWGTYLNNGTYELMSDSFWTSPHVFKDMKKFDPHLYRKLQFAVAVLFKGDLNYRKLLGERNCNPTSSFEAALQGFMPAPLIALRTVKADLICGLAKGKTEQLTKIDERWMEKGEYGVIQFCGKCEALKVSERPCPQYGASCRGAGCGAEGQP